MLATALSTWAQISSERPGLRLSVLDRGVHRKDLAEAIASCRAKASLRGNVQAEVLAEIMASNPVGDWIPSSVFHAHHDAHTLGDVIANLIGHCEPPGARFRLGVVKIEINGFAPLRTTRVSPFLDRHAMAPGGVLAHVAERNRVSIESGFGPVMSSFAYEPINDKFTTLDFATFLGEGSSTETFVLRTVHLRPAINEYAAYGPPFD